MLLTNFREDFSSFRNQVSLSPPLRFTASLTHFVSFATLLTPFTLSYNPNWQYDGGVNDVPGVEGGVAAHSVYDPKTGKTVITTGVSATAKRKGQIGALMANAARMEEVMQREKAKLGKTKRQTNAKYGW